MYEWGAKRVVFVATRHQTGSQSETFRTVAHAIESYDPHSVVIEGVSAFQNDAAKNRFLNHAARGVAEDFIHHGENSYAAHIMHEAGRGVEGGEPTDREVLTAMTGMGYSAQDVSFFYYARAQMQAKARGENLESVEEMAPALAKMFGPDSVSGLTTGAFERWHLENQGIGYSAEELNSAMFIPQRDHLHFLGRMNADVGLVRDRHLLATIQGQLAERDTVLVVYGASHLTTLEAAFEAALPETSKECPHPLPSQRQPVRNR